MVTLIDGVLLVREMSAVRGGGDITLQELADLLSDLIPLPEGDWTVYEALAFAADRIIGGAVVAVELTNALTERLCAVTGEPPADVLRGALDALHPEQEETAA